MPHWIDTHCHLDAPDFAHDRAAMRERARASNVALCVIPSVQRANFDDVRLLAHQLGDAYALGLHPLYIAHAEVSDLAALEAQLQQHRADPRLVAVGEMGLDFFVPALLEPALLEKQERFYRAQLKLAREFDLPVILHVRRSADRLLKYLREVGGEFGAQQAGGPPWRGIAHAFNGSDVQAHAFIQLGFKLGFGGAVTFERATTLRHLAQTLPLDALVLETDSPDIPPHWLYQTMAQRDSGALQGRNEPAELPAIAAVVAQLRGISVQELASATQANALAALPRLAGLLKLP